MNYPTVTSDDIYQAVRLGDIVMAKTILKSSPELINKPNVQGFTLLIIASYNDQEEMVTYLLNNKAAINGQDASGNTALMHAKMQGNERMVSLLNKYEKKI